MRIFKYWSKYSEEVNIDGEKVVISAWGGSNYSPDFAQEEGAQRLSKAHDRIKGVTRRRVEEDYEVDIKEEIVERIDEDNIITRNRYGALVLNSTSLVFIDIDEAKGLTLWRLIVGPRLNEKERMRAHIEKTIAKYYSKMAFRIYETRKGFRLMLSNSMIAPRSLESKLMMRRFRADWLYADLCERQNCYRARLTPKPYRIRQKGIRVKYPERSPDEERELKQWIEEYTERSQQFSTCHLVARKGITRETTAQQVHDRLCKIDEAMRLA